MRSTERAALHDALAEMLQHQKEEPSEKLRFMILGMRYACGILGMPEGSTEYRWSELRDG